MPAGAALVIRLSSLGDVLLAAHLPSLLRAAAPDRRILFATKERFAAVLRNHPDVDRFYVLADGSSDPADPAPLGVVGSGGDLRAALRREQVAEVFDLQQNLRSSGLAAAPEGARRVPFEKHGLRRRLLVHARWLRPRPLPPLLRRYRALAGAPADAPLRPWLRDAFTPSEVGRAAARAGGAGAPPFVVIAAGARWATKRWPVRHVAALAAGVEAELGLASRIAVSPGENDLAAAIAAALPAGGADRIVQLGFRDAAALTARARALVSNDSAFLHLAPALGLPSVGLFGSTIPGFGFASGEPGDAVAEIALACRPCGVHGRTRCPKGHHHCLERLEPSLVLERLRSVLARASSRGPEGP
jgi:ADP-heptose:LPS heptosyltransferase